jgi:hypothetical protein
MIKLLCALIPAAEAVWSSYRLEHTTKKSEDSMDHIRLLCSLFFATTLPACGNTVSEGDLVGTWNVRIIQDDAEVVLFTELLPDHTFRLHVRSAYPDVSADSTGKWFLTGTKLTTTNDKEAGTSSDEVIKADESTLILKDLDAPEHKITEFTRHKGPIPGVVAVSLANSKLTPSPATGSDKPVPAPGTANAPKPPADLVRQLLDDYRLVESKDVARYTLTLDQALRVRVVLDIEDNTPIDVMLLSAKAAERYDAMKSAVAANEADKAIDMLGAMFGKEEADKFKTGSTFTEADFYNRPMSRKAAHRHYETEGILQAGQYVLFLDNSGDIAKTLGDASVHLQIFTRAAN